MHAVQARGQGGGVVRDHLIAGPQEIDQGRTAQMADAPPRVNHQELRLRRTLCGLVGGDHEALTSTAVAPRGALPGLRAGSAAAMASASSRAAASGDRKSVV